MTIARATLPAEFYDKTSLVILRQPEPQYLYARLVYMADASAELMRLEKMGITPERAIGDSGGAMPMLSMFQHILSGDLPFAEAILTTDELAPEKVGHTLRVNRPVFAGGGYTAAQRRVAASQPISTVPIDVSMEQIAVTIERRVGPYDTANSRPAPYAIDKLDAQHSVHSLAQYVGLQLYRDRTKLVDSIYGTLFDSGSVVVYPGDPRGALNSSGTSGDAAAFPTTTAGTRAMDFETLMRMQTTLETANVHRFANGQYVCVLTPQQAQDLMLDPMFAKQAPFTPALNAINPLAASLVKSINGIDVYRSNTNVSDSSTVSGLTIAHGCMFGPGAIVRAGAGPCRAANSTDDNYGETQKVVWIAYEGEAMADNRFVVNVHTN